MSILAVVNIIRIIIIGGSAGLAVACLGLVVRLRMPRAQMFRFLGLGFAGVSIALREVDRYGMKPTGRICIDAAFLVCSTLGMFSTTRSHLDR